MDDGDRHPTSFAGGYQPVVADAGDTLVADEVAGAISVTSGIAGITQVTISPVWGQV